MPDYGDERGFVGPTYRGESPHFSRGLLDIRYPVDSAVQNAHSRPSNRQPLLNQPPMEGPPQRPHVNPRMRHINPRGMGGGLGGLQEQAGLWQDIKRILKNTKNPGPLIDQWTDHWNEQQTADASGIMDKYNQFTDKFGELGVSGEGIEYEKDFDVPWGGTGTIEGQYGDDGFGGGINFTWPLQRAGMDTGLGSFDVAYRPGTYGPDYDDDDYGPFNPPSVYEMDDDWLYDPDKDEYEFDYIHGNLVNTGLA